MKVLRKLFVVLIAIGSLAFGLLLLLEENKQSHYIGIYDEDSTY